MRRSPFFVSLPSATRSESARPRSTFDPDFDITSPLLKPGRRPLAAASAVSFCLATSSGEARRRLRPAPRRTAEAGAAAVPAGLPRGRPRVRPVPIAPPAERPLAPLWSASSLREAFLIASSTDATKDEAIRSSSVRRVPMRAAYRTPQPFCKGIMTGAFEFSLRLSSRQLVTKVFDLVEFAQRLRSRYRYTPAQNDGNQWKAHPFGTVWMCPNSETRRYRQLCRTRHKRRNDCNFRRRSPKDQCADEARSDDSGANEADTRHQSVIVSVAHCTLQLCT